MTLNDIHVNDQLNCRRDLFSDSSQRQVYTGHQHHRLNSA